MRKLIYLIALIATFFACEKKSEFTDTCISSCAPSVPGKINIAIEDHTGLDIRNFTVEINGNVETFSLLPKAQRGSYSCWKSFDRVALISTIRFDLGNNASHLEQVEYTNLQDTREYALDIVTDETDGLRVQLVASPDCVASAN